MVDIHLKCDILSDILSNGNNHSVMSKFRSIVRTAWVLGALLAGLVVGLITVGLGASGPLALISVLCTTIWVTTLRILWEVLAKAEARPEVLTEPKAALDRASQLQDLARFNVCAMWARMKHDDALKKYFRERLKICASKDVHTIRIIDRRNNSIADILDHIQESWEYLKAEIYEIYLTEGIEHEALVVDHTKAAIFHFPGPGFGCIFVTHSETSFVTNTQGEFDRIKNNNSALFPVHNFPVTYDRGAVEKWLRDLHLRPLTP